MRNFAADIQSKNLVIKDSSMNFVLEYYLKFEIVIAIAGNLSGQLVKFKFKSFVTLALSCSKANVNYADIAA
jgi:hypothetical protein